MLLEANKEDEGEDTVNASYSRISEAFRHATAGPMQCQVFCGGKSCKYESSSFWKNDEMAIPGLFSHWVTNKVLAMARPNETEIKNHNMIEAFQKNNIKSIINLQEPGEHASCGYPLLPSGFSYDPVVFMNYDIFHYNFNIKDYSVPLLRTLLDICKVMVFALSEGAIAVHCHAGLGRTGVIIACFLVYHHKMKPRDAILVVRKNRPRSIQTRNQLKAVFTFSLFLKPLWLQFPFLQKKPKYSLEDYVTNQKIVFHGNDQRMYKYTPKLVQDICMWVLEMLGVKSPLETISWKPSKRFHSKTVIKGYLNNDSDNDDLDSMLGDDEMTNVTTVENELFQASSTLKSFIVDEISDDDDADDDVVCSSIKQPPQQSAMNPSVDEVKTEVLNFLDGCSDTVVSGDVEIFMQQINVGNWTALNLGNSREKGTMFRFWLKNLISPLISPSDVETITEGCDICEGTDEATRKEVLVKLKENMRKLPAYQQSTLHCIFITFSFLQCHKLCEDTVEFLYRLLCHGSETCEGGSVDCRMEKRAKLLIDYICRWKCNEILPDI